MEFISKIFRNGRLKIDSKSTHRSDDVFQSQLVDHQFDQENIRFIIFRDHDLKGRSVLFDSLKECGSQQQTKVSRSSSDLKKLADMMFGTLPLSRKATTFKVHSIKVPPQLMITKVFIPQRQSRESTYSDLDSFDLYSIESLSNDDHSHTEPQEIVTSKLARQDIAHSVPLDVPLRQFGCAPSHFDDMDLSTSVHSGTHSLGIPPSVGSTAHLSSSYSSKDRRIRRHKNTMIEHLLTSSMNDEKVDPVPLHKRPTKIGIGVIFLLPDENSHVNRCFQSFFFSHIMLIENYVHRLKGAIDQALAQRSQDLIHQAIRVFLGAMSSLYRAPRLKEPAWLSMMTYKTCRFSLSSRFLKDFTMLVEKCHTKNTKFFLGVLLTAVLTHHLSWAPTVAPVEERPAQTYLDKHAAKWANLLGRSHPYNPLWAQLGDLYGAIGVPLCLSRTVIVGKKQELVSTILFILSYFIRCSEIFESVESFPNFDDSDIHSDSSSETSSIAHDDETTLKSPLPCSKDECSCMSDSSCAMSQMKSSCERSICKNCARRWKKPGFRTLDLEGFQCCPGVANCLDCADSVRPILNTNMLFVKPPEQCFNQVASDLNPLSTSDSITAPVIEKTSALSEASSVTSPTKTKKSLLTLLIEQPCRLKENDVVESPKHENIRNVASAYGGTGSNQLHRVPLGEPESAKALNVVNGYINVDDCSDAAELKRSIQKGFVRRGISMFDEYFVETPYPELTFNFDGSEVCRPIYDIQTFDDILDVPCPDVSQVNIDRLSRTNTTHDTGVDFDESTQLYSEHFGEMDIEDVVGLPDGPSKQIIHMAISKLQDQFTTSGLSLDGDRMVTSGDSLHDQLDRSMSHSRSKKKRHGSGQSLSGRCRSVTLSESSHNRNYTADYTPVPMPSSSESPTATDVGGGCIYLSEDSNLGRSLLGDYCSNYTSHFVIHGTNDREFFRPPFTLLHEDLKTSVQNSVLDEPVAETSCIVADTDDWTVQLFSCKSRSPDEPLKPLPLISSPLVCNLIESVYELARLKMSPEFCLLHLEDQLQSIYLKSQRLAEYIKVNRRYYSQELATLLSLDICDMPLLLAVACTHSPQLFRKL